MSRLNPENEKRGREIIALYPKSRSALLPLLHLAQEQNGWLTPESIKHVADLLDLTAAEVLGVASFYDMFHTEPVGRHLVAVCTNLACLLNGADELLEFAEDKLGIKSGGTTEDGEFTLEEVECLATCDKAPVCAINWRYFHNLTKPEFDKLLNEVRRKTLDHDVPLHGTVTRVRRKVVLPARAPESGVK